MKFRKYIAALLAVVTLLFSGCDLVDQLLQEGILTLPEENNSEGTGEKLPPSADPLYETEGHLHSEESEMLTLFLDWSAVSYDEKNATVTIQVGIHCFGISTGKHQLTVTVNKETQELMTPAIESKKNQEKTFQFATLTFEVDLTKRPFNTLDISAVWDYTGVYNGQEIDGMTVAAKIRLPDGEIITDEDSTDTSDTETTEPPVEDPNAPLYRESGKIASTESKWLILFADWIAVSKDGKTATVTVTPGIECRRLRTRKHTLTVTVNDQSKQLETNVIIHDKDEKITYTLDPLEFEIKLEKNVPTLLTFSLVWEYNDDDGYSQEIIEELTAEITVTFPGGETIEPSVEELENLPTPSSVSVG